jgi:NADH-quinone oxidoreductase subunit M
MTEGAGLLLILLVPAFGALTVAGFANRSAWVARSVAMAAMLIVLVLSLRIFVDYGAGDAARFNFDSLWMPSLGVAFHVRVDGFNVYLLLLGAILFPLALACSWKSAQVRRPLYLALFLILESSLLGTFLAQDLLLFFVFWETVLIPMGILILVFGARHRYQAAMTFFIYTLGGSVLLLAAVIALGAQALQQTGSWSFELDVLYGLKLGWHMQLFVFIAIMLACAVKCPLVPFHSWLPSAYYEAPASASALMAAAMSKMGALGILKLAVPLAPDVAEAASPYMVTWAVISILYGALLALQQENYKKLVAYSSLSHMGYIVIGIFSFQPASIQGSMLQMLSHAMAAAGLFLLLGMLEQRRGADYLRVGALASSAPRFAVVLMAFVLTSLALPLTSGFTAEFMILFGAFIHGLAQWRSGSEALLIMVVLASLGMVLGATYMLKFARALVFDKRADSAPVRDLSAAELLPFALPLLLILWVGIAPGAFITRTLGVATQLSALPHAAIGRDANGR